MRLKNFTIGRKLKDEEVVGPGCLDRIASLVGTMAPFVSPLSFVLPPNLSSNRVAAWIKHLLRVYAGLSHYGGHTAPSFSSALDPTNTYTILFPGDPPWQSMSSYNGHSISRFTPLIHRALVPHQADRRRTGHLSQQCYNAG